MAAVSTFTAPVGLRAPSLPRSTRRGRSKRCEQTIRRAQRGSAPRCRMAGPLGSEVEPQVAERNITVSATATATAPSVEEKKEDHGEQEGLQAKVEMVGKYWVLKEEFRAGINPVEKLKIKKEPMRYICESGELEKLASTPFELLDENKDAQDDLDVRLKWLGLFHRRKRQYGRFMLRLKIPNGVITSRQLHFLADVVAPYGAEGCADVTTRQNMQLRGIKLEDVPALFTGMNEVGLSSFQSGMDNVRNVVGSPLAGIDPCEIIDTRPITDLVHNYLTAEGKGNPSVSNLPRKFNIAVVGSHDLYEHPHINDLAFVPAISNGVLGFNVLVGGFFSPKRCAEAVPLDAWVSVADVVTLSKGVLEAYRDLGSRGNRQKTRVMWLIDEMGIEGFRAEVSRRFPKELQRAIEVDLVDATWKRRSLFGVHKQRQQGLNFVGVKVPVGRVQAAEMHELARLAEHYGSSELRLTVEQNLLIVNVPDDNVNVLLADLSRLPRFSVSPGNIAAGSVACTGNQFCGLAQIETKANALKLTEQLERTMIIPRVVRMHWTGCPNSCGQVQVADLGFMGCSWKDRITRESVEGVNIFMGGKIGADSHLGDCIREKVPIAELLPVVQDLLVEYFGAERQS